MFINLKIAIDSYGDVNIFMKIIYYLYFNETVRRMTLSYVFENLSKSFNGLTE